MEMLDAVESVDGVRSNDVKVAEDGEGRGGRDGDDTVGVRDGTVGVNEETVGERVDCVGVTEDTVIVNGDAVGVIVDGDEGVGDSEGGDGGIGDDAADTEIVSGTVLSRVPGVTGDGLGLKNEVSMEVSNPSGTAIDCTDGDAPRKEDSYDSSVSGAHIDSRIDGLGRDGSSMDGVLGVGVSSVGARTELGETEDSVGLDSVESSDVLMGSVGDGGTTAGGETETTDGETEGGSGTFSGWTLTGGDGIVGTSVGSVMLSLSTSSRGSSEGMLPYSVGARSTVEYVVEATSATENSVGAFSAIE